MTVDDLLVDFARGALGRAESLVVGAHASLDPRAGEVLHDLEHVGGLLLEEIEPVAMAGAPDLPGLLTVPEQALVGQEGSRRERSLLDRLLHDGQDAAPWRWVMPGMWRIPLPAHSDGEARASLVRFSAGRAVPRHAHHGQELTLVLQGGYADETGSYRAGALAIANEETEHCPRALDGRDCICLIAAHGGLRVRNPLISLPRAFFG